MRPARTALMSFDVFDTVLTRAVADPADQFLLLGRRLAQAGTIGCSAEVFAVQRFETEARISAGHRCPTLPEICAELAASVGHPQPDSAALAKAEMDLERQLVRAVPSALDRLKRLRENDTQINFLTDTYHSSAFIEELLERNGAWRDGDRVFASCELRADKGRGMMFPAVARILRSHPKRFVHHGNDAIGDLRNGRLSGWQVTPLTDANPNRYERALAAGSMANGGLSSILGGAARAARLQLGHRPGSREETLSSVAVDVMAPLLTAWVITMMRRAARQGCTRLYFVSRDGEVLLDIARRLESVLHTGLELRYLYITRHVIQPAGSVTRMLSDLARLQTFRLQDMADRFGLTLDELQSILPGSLKRADPERNLTASQRESLLQLAVSGPGAALLGRQSAQARADLEGYLRQEGWTDEAKFGVVDVGWRATMAGCLSEIFPGGEVTLPHRYYFFGLSESAYEGAGAAADRIEAWSFDEAKTMGYVPCLPSTISLLEMFCAGHHGAVIGLERAENGHMSPVLRTPLSPMHEWGLPIVRQAVDVFLSELLPVLELDLVDLDLDARPQLHQALELFWLEPTSAEVAHWGTFPVEVSGANTLVTPLGEVITGREAISALRAGRFRLRSEHSWPRATADRSPWPVGAVLSAAIRVKAELPRTRRRLAWARQRFLP